MRLLLVASLLACAAFPALANDALTQRPDIKKALAYIESSHEKTLATQVTIAEIPAPTFHESERAKYMAEQFRLRGLKNVEIDKQGNVLGWRDGETQDTFVGPTWVAPGTVNPFIKRTA